MQNTNPSNYRSRLPSGILFLAAVLLAASITASAATITVSTTNDSGEIITGEYMKNHTLFMFAILLATSIVAPAVATPAQTIQVGNVEELYSAVNDPANTSSALTLAPGVYMLSATDPSGAARANGGRLDLLENMSLMGVEGDRYAVVIDATNLPDSSYRVPQLNAAVRLGRGNNSIEWLTVRNARFGQANIDTTLRWPGTAFVRIAHIASTGGQRGLDIRNAGAQGASGETIEADIVDSDFFDNNLRSPNMGVRLINANTGPGTVINARMIGNRSWGHTDGRVIANETASNSTINVFSTGNRFFGNGEGTVILGGAAFAGTLVANGNTINFEAKGDQFVDNTALFDPDYFGGLRVVGGNNQSSIPNKVNNNTVNVSLWGCRMENNVTDLLGIGARSIPGSIAPGVNNHVTIEIHGEGPVYGRWGLVEFFADSIPADPSLNNSVTVIR